MGIAQLFQLTQMRGEVRELPSKGRGRKLREGKGEASTESFKAACWIIIIPLEAENLQNGCKGL